MLEDPFGEQEHRKMLSLKILKWLAFAAIVLLAFTAGQTKADPLAMAQENGVKITLYTDECQLKDVVSLPNRVTWEERGKVFEGCWGPSPLGVVMAYFKEDKSVAAIPFQAFQPVKGV